MPSVTGFIGVTGIHVGTYWSLWCPLNVVSATSPFCHVAPPYAVCVSIANTTLEVITTGGILGVFTVFLVLFIAFVGAVYIYFLMTNLFMYKLVFDIGKVCVCNDGLYFYLEFIVTHGNFEYLLVKLIPKLLLSLLLIIIITVIKENVSLAYR